MVKVLGKLETLVIKGEDCLKEGQHLKRTQRIKSTSERETDDKTLWQHDIMPDYDLIFE